jgi:hypothetical protein
MNYLKRLAVAISLAVVLASAAFAGETNTPPCPIPGETNTPPCSGQFVADESDEANTIAIELEVFVLEAATYGIESLLTVF